MKRLYRLSYIACTLFLASCVPALNVGDDSHLTIIALDGRSPRGIVAVDSPATFIIVGRHAHEIQSVRWEMHGRVLPGTGPSTRVVFHRPGPHVVRAYAQGRQGLYELSLLVDVTLPARPPNTPDVIVLAFSGRCGPLCHPDDNSADWTEAHRSAIQGAFAAAGVSQHVELRQYRSHLHDRDGFGKGFLSALAELDDLHQSLANGFLNPTRFVLLSHSHGTQFAHLLARERPELTFAASILLDSVCFMWDVDHAETYVRQLRMAPGTRLGSGPFSVGCKVVRVSGRRLDHGDAIPSNVDASLEVWSGGSQWAGGFGLVRDVTPNDRVTTLGAYSRAPERLVVSWEDHERIARAYSFGFRSAADWLAATLRGFGN